MRSFAEALGIGSGALSQILSGKRTVSTKLTERIFKFLELSPVEQKKFLESVIAEKKNLKRTSPALKSKLEKFSSLPHERVAIDRGLSLDEFRIVSEWYHNAILELTFAKDFHSDSRWIAQALGITVMEAKLAVERLLQLELLEEVNGNLMKTDFNLDTKDKSKTSAFLKRRQKQILLKSIESLENDPIEERNHSALTVCIAQDQIPEAKKRIQAFMWELAQVLVKGEPERVYELSVNLFPLQKQKIKERKNEK